MQNFGQKLAPAAGLRPAIQWGQDKNVAFWVSSRDNDNKFGPIPKKKDFGPKNCIFGPQFCIFLCYTYETPIFWLRRMQLNWIICPPYPEVTLDNFGFLVGGCLAAWQAVSCPRLPKVALLGSKFTVFWHEINFLWSA